MRKLRESVNICDMAHTLFNSFNNIDSFHPHPRPFLPRRERAGVRVEHSSKNNLF
jgi:hypothetical protein